MIYFDEKDYEFDKYKVLQSLNKKSLDAQDLKDIEEILRQSQWCEIKNVPDYTLEELKDKIAWDVEGISNDISTARFWTKQISDSKVRGKIESILEHIMIYASTVFDDDDDEEEAFQ